jgi:small subunit ribosomal protein S2
MKIPSLEELLKAGVHFGHRTSRWHPKMREYIFGTRAGVHVIDVTKTQEILEKSYNDMVDTASKGDVWLIGTKQHIQNIVEEAAEAHKLPYISKRWIGGTFTNFEQIKKLIDTYLDLRDKREKGELKKYTKLEQIQFDRKIDELEEKIGGISTIKDVPAAIFLLDLRQDKTVAVEARKRGIKVFAICDTNVNPDLVDVAIPANDDAVAGVKIITDLMAAAIAEGRAKQKAAPTEKKSEAKKAPKKKVEAKAE